MDRIRSSIKRNWRTFWGRLAQLADVFVIGASYVIAAIAQNDGQPLTSALIVNLRFGFFVLVLFLGFNVARGLYRKISYISLARQLFHSGLSYGYTAAVVFSVYFLTSNVYYPKAFLLQFFVELPVIYFLVWMMLRLIAARLGKSGYGRWNTMLIGPSKDLHALENRIDLHPELGYDVREIMTIPTAGRGLLHVDPKKVAETLDSHKIQLIVLSSAHLNGSYDHLEEICTHRGTAMRLVSAESDFLFSRARLQDFAGIPLFSPPRTRIEAMKRVVKRGFDIAGATIGLMVLSPLFLVIAVLTKLESPGPVFFKQKRSLSDHDVPFDFYKFRSMHHLADEKRAELAHWNESNGALFKIKDDPRLTRIGKLMRRHSLDELPQLINVLKGEMSLVGPRPLPVRDFKHIGARDHMGGYFRRRTEAKPGMTGLWQISGRSDLGFREMVLLDLYYIENQTILFDIEILLQTVPVVIFGKGAY
jgi:exopolysaccharide biosynthesis polyprenyl glycosylphosphotransferase